MNVRQIIFILHMPELQYDVFHPHSHYALFSTMQNIDKRLQTIELLEKYRLLLRSSFYWRGKRAQSGKVDGHFVDMHGVCGSLIIICLTFIDFTDST